MIGRCATGARFLQRLPLQRGNGSAAIHAWAAARFPRSHLRERSEQGQRPRPGGRLKPIVSYHVPMVNQRRTAMCISKCHQAMRSKVVRGWLQWPSAPDGLSAINGEL